MSECGSRDVGPTRLGVVTSKFYFMDAGVARALQGRAAVAPDTAEYGDALETYLMHELSAWTDYESSEPRVRLSDARSKRARA